MKLDVCLIASIIIFNSFGMANFQKLSLEPTPKPTKKEIATAQGIKDKENAVLIYNAYKNLNSELDLSFLINELPPFFEDIPDTLKKSVLKLAELRFGVKAKSYLEKILIQDPQILLRFKWRAIGLELGTIPFYYTPQNYFYFAKPEQLISSKKENVYSILEYEKLKNFSASLKNKIQQVQHEQEILEAELKKLDLPGSQCAIETIELKKQLEITKSMQNELSAHSLQVLTDLQEMGKKLTYSYKIHLMPKGDMTPVIITLLEHWIKDPELYALLYCFKVMASNAYKNDKRILARIVIYPIEGKENAQKVLNKLYNIFKDTPGLNEQPRFNAKVTDLIWVAQGDSGRKKGSILNYYEPPLYAYYHPDFTGKVENYHLIHPATGKEIR